jgi:hypothetical protein
MSMTNRPVFLLLALAAGLGLGAPHADAVTNLTFDFRQEGYAGGAAVTGSFTGADLDGNGILVHFPTGGPGGPAFPIANSELTSLEMHYSGNSLSPAFDLALADLYGFVYQLNTPALGDDPAFDPTVNRNLIEGIGLIGAGHFYTSGLGPNGMVGGYVGGPIDLSDQNALADHALDATNQPLQVAPVPEPASAALLLVAGAATRVGRRHRVPLASRQ